ncbi:hypothetical protein KGF56_003219 [Candida oxycetoniae]|uniref:Uncharacterized protein n=1 Tax=Candida oxycetoniae TaxID=497107 RepID=A0AAI9SVX6_9ASCO|nr:uncharacterized protein KGF56_003219 [Candida oxycetoniae]KAI3403952.2 hypothetical protein KGF56_003219 [Candida oxycetoniae]
MSLKLKNRSNRARNWKIGLVSGAVIIGTSYLILNTFPHLKTSIYNVIYGTEDESEEDDERDIQTRRVVIESEHSDPNNRNKTIDLFQSERAFNAQDKDNEISTWAVSELKSWLVKV